MRIPRSPPPKRAQQNGNETQSESNLSDVSNAPTQGMDASRVPQRPSTRAVSTETKAAPGYIGASGVCDVNDSEVVEILAKQKTKGKTSGGETPPTELEKGTDRRPPTLNVYEDNDSTLVPSQSTRNPGPNHLTKGDTNPEIRRLDSDAYKPWGTRSNNSSPVAGLGSADNKEHDAPNLFVCTGGPGKVVCNITVKEGEGSAECEKCSRWFHNKCQGLSKGAVSAMNRWHGTLLWFCDSCSKSLKTNPSQRGMKEAGTAWRSWTEGSRT